jgi:TPP-dependent indolepyruvate ferredoxin oxidoreductase alpha subunit
LAPKLVTGYEAFGLGLQRSGVQVVAGPAGTVAADCLADLLAGDAPRRRIDWSVDELVALEVAAGAAWAGRRALCLMPVAGIHAAGAALCAIVDAGSRGALVIALIGGPREGSGPAEQDWTGLARLSQAPVLEPSSVAEVYTLIQASFELSEHCGAPVYLHLPDRIGRMTADVDIDALTTTPERTPIPENKPLTAGQGHAGGAPEQRRMSRARLVEAEQVIHTLGLNRLYLAPREGPESISGRANRIEEVVPEQTQAAGRSSLALNEGWWSQFQDALRQAQEAVSSLRPARQSWPGPVQDAWQQAQDLLHQAHELPIRQAHELIVQAQEALSTIGQQMVPAAQPAMRHAQDALRQVQEVLPGAAQQSQQPVEVRFVEPPPVLRHPLQRSGFGIIAAGVMAGYLDEGLAQMAASGIRHWPTFGPHEVSILRLASLYPLPHVEIQALMRHCSTLLVLEELEPHIEKDLYMEALQSEFEGTIIGKLNRSFGRSCAAGVSQVVRGLAAALEVQAPDVAPAGPCSGPSPDRQPGAICPTCPFQAIFLALDQALFRSGVGPDAVVIADHAGCSLLNLKSPFSLTRRAAISGAGIPFGQGYLRGGGGQTVIVIVDEAVLHQAGLAGLINAVAAQESLLVVIAQQVRYRTREGRTKPDDWACGLRPVAWPVDTAALIHALGIEQLLVIDIYEEEEAAAALARALALPGVKAALARN